MDDRYALDGRHTRKLKWEILAAEAERNIPDGRIGEIILQLRQRGFDTDTRANYILGALIFVIFVGLAFFIGRPILQDSVDGRKITYQQLIEEAGSENSKLDQDRLELKARLAEGLRPIAETVDSLTNKYNDLHYDAGRSLLIAVGEKSAIARSTDSGSTWHESSLNIEDEFNRLYAYENSKYMIATIPRAGDIARSSDYGQDWNIVTISENSRILRIVDGGGPFLVANTNEGFYLSNDYGSDWKFLNSNFQDRFGLAEPEISRSGILAVAIFTNPANGKHYVAFNNGAVARFTNNLELEEVAIAHKNSFAFFHGTQVAWVSAIARPPNTAGGKVSFDENYKFYYSEENETLLLSDGAAISITSDGGDSWKPVVERDAIWSAFGHVTIPTNLIQMKDGVRFVAVSDSGGLISSNDGGLTWNTVTHDRSETIVGLSYNVGSDIVTGFGSNGMIVSVDSTFAATRVRTQSTENIVGYYSVADGRAAFLMNASSYLYRSTDGGERWSPTPVNAPITTIRQWRSSDTLLGYSRLGIYRSTNLGRDWIRVGGELQESGIVKFFPKGEKSMSLIALTRDGRIHNVSDTRADIVSKLALAAGVSGDAKLGDWFDSQSLIIRQSDNVGFFASEFAALQRNRIAADQKLEKALLNLEKIDRGVFDLDRRRSAFASYMDICRGSGRDGIESRNESDAVLADNTSACVAAFKDFLPNSDKIWWNTLAEQLPFGILFLFLLATLGTLYRYNLRLAAFHHSRADALLMVTADRETDWFEKYAAVLAADKVEFGKTNTPADQAVEIAKSIIGKLK